MAGNKRSLSGAATVNERGNITGSEGARRPVKRTGSAQQSTLSFSARKATAIPPSPVKKSPSTATIKTSTKPLLKPSLSNVSLSTEDSPKAALETPVETPEMIRNLEMPLYPGDEGLESLGSSSDDDDLDEKLITPKKARLSSGPISSLSGTPRQRKGKLTKGQAIVEEDVSSVLPQEGDASDDAIMLHSSDEESASDDVSSANARTLLFLSHGKSPSDLAAQSKGSRVRSRMLQANAEIEQAKLGTTKEKKGEKAAGVGAKLNVKDKKWSSILSSTKEAMGAKDCPPIHCTPKSHTNIHHILRTFDLTGDYGPCVGLTRLQRWERAQEWGLEPPQEIKEILLTMEGASDSSYRETVFDDTGIYCSSS